MPHLQNTSIGNLLVAEGVYRLHRPHKKHSQLHHHPASRPYPQLLNEMGYALMRLLKMRLLVSLLSPRPLTTTRHHHHHHHLLLRTLLPAKLDRITFLKRNRELIPSVTKIKARYLEKWPIAICPLIGGGSKHCGYDTQYDNPNHSMILSIRYRWYLGIKYHLIWPYSLPAMMMKLCLTCAGLPRSPSRESRY